MRLKTLTVSVVILAIISAIVYVVQRPTAAPSADPRVGQPLADRGVIENATKLQLSDQGKTVTLTRQPDGAWIDTSYYDLPADFSKLSSFVDSLHEAKVDRFVTANPERLDRLEFKDTKIELLDRASKPLWSLTIGKTADSGGRFVKFDDEKKAYLATLTAYLDSDPKNWANAELLNLKADDIAKIEAQFPAVPASPTEPKSTASPETTVTLSRAKKDAPWTSPQTPANDQVKADKVSSLLGDIGTLRFTDTNDLSDPNAIAAKQHERVFKLTTFEGKTYTIAIGRKPEEKKLKPPTAGKTGPAALGSVTDLAKKEEAEKKDKKPDETKPITPEFETIPAGPVFVFVTSSTATDPINHLMTKRAFQIGDYIFTGLPQKADELFEPAPKPAAPTKPDAKKADEKKASEPVTK